MSRRAARGLHLALILLGVLLYLVFVLPRWWVLTGDIPSGLAMAGRLAAGVPIAAAAFPVFAILRDSLARKTQVPELALRLRAWSAVLHLCAGGLILLAAVVEIWLRLGVGGPYLFAVYGAAAAIAILAVLALYLSFVAEKPPAEPKPPKPKKVKARKVKAKTVESETVESETVEPETVESETVEPETVEPEPSGMRPSGKKKRGAAAEAVDETADSETKAVVLDTETTDTDDAATEVEAVQTVVVSETVETVVVDGTIETVVVSETIVAETQVEAAEAASTGLRNKRPAGKRFRRLGR